jgi:hypothetical protein
VGSFRSAWAWPGRGGGADAVALFFKGGSNAYDVGASNNHGHLDVGTFCFEAAGYRWAIDFEHDAYDFPLLNNFGRFRWGYKLVSSAAHNVLQIGDGDSQSHTGSGGFVAWNLSAAGGGAWATIDATSAYGGTRYVNRTFRFLPAASAGACATVVISDVWGLDAAFFNTSRGGTRVAWQMLTTATAAATGEPGVMMLSAPNGPSGQERRLAVTATALDGSAVQMDAPLFIAPPPQMQDYYGSAVYTVRASVDSTAGGISVLLQPQPPCT